MRTMVVGHWVIYTCSHLFKLHFLFTLWLSSIRRLLLLGLLQSFHVKSSWSVSFLHSSCWHQCFISLVLKCTESKCMFFQCWGSLPLESLAWFIFIKQSFSCQQYACPHVLHLRDRRSNKWRKGKHLCRFKIKNVKNPAAFLTKIMRFT